MIDRNCSVQRSMLRQQYACVRVGVRACLRACVQMNERACEGMNGVSKVMATFVKNSLFSVS